LAGTHPQIQETPFRLGIPSKQDRQVLGRSMVLDLHFSSLSSHHPPSLPLATIDIVTCTSQPSSLSVQIFSPPSSHPPPAPLFLYTHPPHLTFANNPLRSRLTGSFRRVWVTWRYNVAGSYILPINFYNYVDMSGTDESKFRILRVRVSCHFHFPCFFPFYPFFPLSFSPCSTRSSSTHLVHANEPITSR
jgi:hypothetical protein